MGLEGDQDLNAAQNRNVAEFHSSDIELYLFEVFERGKYVYQGEISLRSEPAPEKLGDRQ